MQDNLRKRANNRRGCILFVWENKDDTTSSDFFLEMNESTSIWKVPFQKICIAKFAASIPFLCKMS